MALSQTRSSRMISDLMLLQPVILGSQNVMNAVDGATIERRIRISQLDEGSARCKVSRAWDPRKDFSQPTQPPILTESESRGPPPLRINYAMRFGHQQEGCWDESPIGGQQQVAICGLCRRTCECDRACRPGRPTARLLPGLDNAVRA